MFGADGDEAFVRMPEGSLIVVAVRADVAQFPFGVANNPSHARSHACRTRSHALGAWYTACSMIPGNGGVPSPTTAFRRSTVSRSSQRRLHQRRRWRRSLHHPLGEHRDFLPRVHRRLVDVEVVLRVVMSVSVATSSETESASVTALCSWI